MDEQTDQHRTAPGTVIYRALCLILFFAGVSGLVTGWFWLRGSPQARVAILSDGSRVELLGTSVGTNYFSNDMPWQRVARRYLPSRLAQRWLPPTINGTVRGSSNGIDIYVRITGPAAVPGGARPWQEYGAQDTNGFLFSRNGGYSTFGVGPGSSNWVTVFDVSSYPRRQPEFLLCFYTNYNGGAMSATLRVPNPMQGPFPVWRPLKLPQTFTNGPVSLTLKSLRPVGAPGSPYISPDWLLESADPAWAHARVRYWAFHDATGNEGAYLSQSEPVWQLHALVYRERPQDFTASERFVLTNLAIPKPGRFLDIDQSNICAGVSLNVQVLSSAGTITTTTNGGARAFSPGGWGHSTSYNYGGGTNGVMVENWGYYSPFLLVEAKNVQALDDIQFHIRDDTGREIKAEVNGYDGLPNNGRMYHPTFTLPIGAKSISLEILVSRPLVFDFMVNPADLRAAKP